MNSAIKVARNPEPSIAVSKVEELIVCIKGKDTSRKFIVDRLQKLIDQAKEGR